MSSKERLDVLLVNRGLADSREKAKAIIMSGNVYVDGQKEDKAGSSFNETVNIEVSVGISRLFPASSNNRTFAFSARTPRR